MGEGGSIWGFLVLFCFFSNPQINCPARWSHHSLLWAIWSDVINPGDQQPKKVEPYVLSEDKQ